MLSWLPPALTATKQKTTGPTRTITLSHIHDNYNPTPDIGATYRIVVWIVAARDGSGYLLPSTTAPAVTFTDGAGKEAAGCAAEYRAGIGAVVAMVPVQLASGAPLVITQSVGGAGDGVNGANGLH